MERNQHDPMACRTQKYHQLIKPQTPLKLSARPSTGSFQLRAGAGLGSGGCKAGPSPRHPSRAGSLTLTVALTRQLNTPHTHPHPRRAQLWEVEEPEFLEKIHADLAEHTNSHRESSQLDPYALPVNVITTWCYLRTRYLTATASTLITSVLKIDVPLVCHSDSRFLMQNTLDL